MVLVTFCVHTCENADMKSNSMPRFASQGQGCGKRRLYLKEVPERKEDLGAKADHENLSSLRASLRRVLSWGGMQRGLGSTFLDLQERSAV